MTAQLDMLDPFAPLACIAPLAPGALAPLSKRRNAVDGIDVERVEWLARLNAEAVLAQWMPQHRFEGRVFVGRARKREVAVNLDSLDWHDRGLGPHGHGLVALAGQVFLLDRAAIHQRLAGMLRVAPLET